MVQVFGCGYNGFHQLDCFQHAANFIECGQQAEKVARHDWQVKQSKSKLVCNFKKAAVKDVKITWSRMAICFKTGNGSYATAVSGSLLTDNKPEADRENEPLFLDNVICQAASHADILLKDMANQKGFKVLQDGKNTCKIINLLSGQASEVDLKCVSGGHDQIYCIHNCSIFGQFSCSNIRGSKSQDVANVVHENEDKDQLTASIKLFDYILPMKQISCGKEHVLFLSESGNVFSFGLSSRGQLGHGDVEGEKETRIVETLEGLPIKAIAAGGWHSVAVSEIGDVYVWGWNESGQLGLSSGGKGKSQSMDDSASIGIQAVPKCLDVPGEANVKDATCGARHTVILTEEGRVFTCGWNNYGQLGLGHVDPVDTLTEVKGLPGSCSQIFAGQWNSVFVCKD